MKLYNELAEFYFDIEKPARKIDSEAKFLDRLFRKHRIMTILDMGCGTGEHVRYFQSLGYRPKGIDSSPRMIDVAKKDIPIASSTCHRCKPISPVLFSTVSSVCSVRLTTF
ncbi:methyltransferase domain protein [Leptospira weilii str. Ecochallenge]|uniref:Methyltransferase domain protein n=1 Tax=Leptospira weilii str. Ecochallenge TaxID=1049986 RepID=N1U7D3_9LEPT|nr:methyltransferase domain protein [Leptospira weilii str. Ecochallenge]